MSSSRKWPFPDDHRERLRTRIRRLDDDAAQVAHRHELPSAIWVGRDLTGWGPGVADKANLHASDRWPRDAENGHVVRIARTRTGGAIERGGNPARTHGVGIGEANLLAVLSGREVQRRHVTTLNGNRAQSRGGGLIGSVLDHEGSGIKPVDTEQVRDICRDRMRRRVRTCRRCAARGEQDPRRSGAGHPPAAGFRELRLYACPDRSGLRINRVAKRAPMSQG